MLPCFLVSLSHIVNKFDRVKYVDIDECSYRCIIRTAHGLPYASELVIYGMMQSYIPVNVVHIFLRRLNCFDDGFNKSSQLSLKPRFIHYREDLMSLTCLEKFHLRVKYMNLFSEKQPQCLHHPTEET